MVDKDKTSSEEHLREFLLDTKNTNWKEKLRQYTGVNVFRVLGLERAEIKHSKMLAWLFNPNGNHGLHEEFLREFITELCKKERNRIDVLDYLALDYDDVTVTCESDDNIDILIVFNKSKTVICIENKIDAAEHGSNGYESQLDKYWDYIKGNYKDETAALLGSVQYDYSKYRHVFVFLTPDGRRAVIGKHNDDWVNTDYRIILTVLEDIFNKRHENLSLEAELLIKNYTDLIRSDIVGNAELKKLCEGIYKEYGKAIDLIFKYKPNKLEFIRDILEENRREMITDVALRYNKVLCKTKNLTNTFSDLGDYTYWYTISIDENFNKCIIRLWAEFKNVDAITATEIMKRFAEFKSKICETNIIDKSSKINEGQWSKTEIIKVISGIDILDSKATIVESIMDLLEKGERINLEK